MSLVVQYLVSQGVAEDLDNFNELSHEIALGWKIEIAKDTAILMDDLGYDVLWMAEHHFQREGMSASPTC